MDYNVVINDRVTIGSDVINVTATDDDKVCLKTCYIEFECICVYM